MGERIRLYMEDWLYNSGLVGFYNILKHAEDDVKIGAYYIEFELEYLMNFEKKYYKYFRDKYKNVTVYSNLINNIEYLIDNSEISIDTKRYEKELKYIKDKLKNSAYTEIREELEMSQLNKPTVEFLKKILLDIKDKKDYILQKETIGYFDQKAKISKSPNAIVDKYINTNMLDIDKLLEEILAYKQKDTTNYKFKCFTCENIINKIDNGFSFLNNMYFDTARKTSHTWDCNIDIEICPICRLIYFCVPAGFTTIYGKGIYVNITSNMKSAIDINEKVKLEVLKENGQEQNLTYRSLISTINERDNDIIKYELTDIQLIRCENNIYKFNILSKKSLQIIRDSRDDLDKLINCGFKEINTYFNVYELVIDRLLNSQNMFTLVQKMLHYKLSQPKDSHYHQFHVIRILRINTRFLKGVGCMRGVYKDIVKEGNEAGEKLREKYRSKGAVDKLGGISYRLLNSLKTNNKDSFMDTLLNCYLYVKSSVPEVFLDALKDEERLKTIGYAFVAGLIEGKKENNNDNENGGKDNE